MKVVLIFAALLLVLATNLVNAAPSPDLKLDQEAKEATPVSIGSSPSDDLSIEREKRQLPVCVLSPWLPACRLGGSCLPFCGK